MDNNVPSVDQSDREVPINLRQSGPTPVEMLIDTRVRKSPYWELSMQQGCWRASIYNRMYHPRGAPRKSWTREPRHAACVDASS